jgi:hypothetical protein
VRSSTKALAFPLAGVARRGAHRQQARPFTAPWAINVRTVGPNDQRRRGGSRPGLAKFCPTDLGVAVTSLIPVTYYDADGERQHDLVFVADGALGTVREGVSSVLTAELEGPDGEDILTPDGQTIDFGAEVTNGAIHGTVRAGKVYLADSVLRTYDPATGVVETVVATEGTVPTGCPLIALYRDRIFLAGADQTWFCSRVSDPTDWDHGAAMEDPGAATVGQLSDAGRMGDVLTAMVPIHDQVLVMATENSLWALRGDPVGGGRLQNVSDELGIIARDAWAISPDGLLAFLSNDGVYLWAAGSSQAPIRFSADRLPDELREVDTDENTVSMAYDPVWRGFHLFVTPDEGVGYHWFLDLDGKAFWPQRFVEGHQPLAAACMTESGLGNVVLASQDGYLRYFQDGATDDDGEPLESHVMLGPIHLAADDARDAMLAEIHGTVDEVSNDGVVTWRVVMGRSADEAVANALEDLDLLLDSQADLEHVAASGEWTDGRSLRGSPRSRGPWVVVWLSSTEAWSYEAVNLVARQLGRHR